VTEPSPAAPQAALQAPIAPQATPAASPASSSPSPAPAPRSTIADVAYDRLPPDRQSQYARIKDADNNPEWVRRDELATDRTTKPDGTTTEAPPPADPLAKHKIGDLEVSQAELQEYMQSKAADELKKAALPPTPADYKADLPPGFQMPAGISEFKFDTTDPLFTSAQAWAHARQIDQGTFSEMVGLYASAKATEAAELNAAHADQVAKMGANGPLRVTALETWFRGVVGDDKIAGQMKNMLVTADIVKGMERIQARTSSQGIASFSQAHREPGQANNGRVSDAAYAAMSPGEKLNYSRGFDQSQFRNQ
jgi:hypothetical protein